MDMVYTPEGSRAGWVQQPMAWWGVAAHGGLGLWSLETLGLLLPSPPTAGGGAGAPHGLPGCPEAGMPTVGLSPGMCNGQSLGRHLVQLWGDALLTSGDLSL